MTKL
ncbi:hypothetical protein D047_3054A, partial [Vibrio parahaemolyticus VPTS-2010_2]|jgi:serum/glucocorticoid-regulated kinase 2